MIGIDLSGDKSPSSFRLVSMSVAKYESAKYDAMVVFFARQWAEAVDRPDLIQDLSQEGKIAAHRALISLPEHWSKDEVSIRNFVRFRVLDAFRSLLSCSIDDVEFVYLDEPVSSEGEDLSLHDLIGTPADQESLLVASEEIGRLPPYARQIGALRAEGLSFDEIGSRLGRTSGAVREALSKIRRAA